MSPSRFLLAILLPDQGGWETGNIYEFERIELPDKTKRHAFRGRLYDVHNAADRGQFNADWQEVSDLARHRNSSVMRPSSALFTVLELSVKAPAPVPAPAEPESPPSTPSSEELSKIEVDVAETAPVALPKPPPLPEPTPPPVEEKSPEELPDLPEPEPVSPPKPAAKKKGGKK